MAELERAIAKFEKLASDPKLTADMRLVYANHLQDLKKQQEGARTPLPDDDGGEE